MCTGYESGFLMGWKAKLRMLDRNGGGGFPIEGFG